MDCTSSVYHQQVCKGNRWCIQSMYCCSLVASTCVQCSSRHTHQATRLFPVRKSSMRSMCRMQLCDRKKHFLTISTKQFCLSQDLQHTCTCGWCLKKVQRVGTYQICCIMSKIVLGQDIAACTPARRGDNQRQQYLHLFSKSDAKKIGLKEATKRKLQIPKRQLLPSCSKKRGGKFWQQLHQIYCIKIQCLDLSMALNTTT